MNYAEISKETISLLYKTHASLKDSPLDPVIKVLAELRTSQINGCAYCCRVHTNEAKVLKVSTEKIDDLQHWKDSKAYTEAELAALLWTEKLTEVKDFDQEALVEIRKQLTAYFSERELVDLTICISMMNALNRIAISLKDDN